MKGPWSFIIALLWLGCAAPENTLLEEESKAPIPPSAEDTPRGESSSTLPADGTISPVSDGVLEDAKGESEGKADDVTDSPIPAPDSSLPNDVQEETQGGKDGEDTPTLDQDAEGGDSGNHSSDTEGAHEDSSGDTQDTEQADTQSEPCAPCGPSSTLATYSLDSGTFASVPERTRDNPLKGFMTSYLWGEPANDFPDQMEFAYIPMADVWGPEGATFESSLEPLLTEAASRGHHLVMRIFIDYPKKDPGLPPHLADIVPCQTYTEHGGGCSPDYDHPALVSAMVDLMTALGAQYDGDPRLGALQVGLLGFWGEWHTWPHVDWFPSAETQEALLTAVVSAFPKTQVQLREPKLNSATLPLGYHDDSFAHSTLGDIGWFFWPKIIAAGDTEKWKTAMMGGELRPELQGECFTEDYSLGENAQDVGECIEVTHASYLLNYKAFNKDGMGYSGEERLKAEEAALQMGYQFALVGAELTLGNLQGDLVDAKVHLTLEQEGNAPFYYDLFASLKDEEGTTLSTQNANLKGLLPGSEMALEFELGTLAIEKVLSPIYVVLTSPRQLSGQSILLATDTPWTKKGKSTGIYWEVTCETEEESIPVGTTLWPENGDCPCVCDVDGQLRGCDGGPCL